MAGRLAGAMAAIAMIAVLAEARPAAAEPLRLVLIVAPGGDDVAPRLEGQLADLDVTLTVVTAPLPAALPDAAAAAAGLARGAGAAAAIWLRADAAGYQVHVVTADGGRLLVRAVDARAEGLDPSAVLESAAMIVRTAARGLLAGDAVGDVVEPAPPPAPIGPPPPIATPTPGRPPRVRPWGQVGWRHLADGDDLGHGGLDARAGVARGGARVAALLQLQPAVDLTAAAATIGVSRQAVGAMAGVELARGRRWRLAAEAALTAVRYARATTATSPALSPTADRASWTPVVTPAVRGTWRVAPHVALALGVGLDLVVRPPRFTADTAAGTVVVAAPWSVQPALDLSLVIE